MYRLWDLQTHKVYFPGASIESSTPFYDGDRCLFETMGEYATPRALFDGEWPSYNVTLGCYPGAIKAGFYKKSCVGANLNLDLDQVCYQGDLDQIHYRDA